MHVPLLRHISIILVTYLSGASCDQAAWESGKKSVDIWGLALYSHVTWTNSSWPLRYGCAFCLPCVASVRMSRDGLPALEWPSPHAIPFSILCLHGNEPSIVEDAEAIQKLPLSLRAAGLWCGQPDA